MPENETVLAYLEVEQLPSWRTSTSPWVVEGYSLSTHPDLCDRVRELGDAAKFRFAFGRPVLAAANGVIVAFGAGTHIFCVRVPRAAVDPRLVVEAGPDLGPAWTRVDPWTAGIPRAEGLAALAALESATPVTARTRPERISKLRVSR